MSRRIFEDALGDPVQEPLLATSRADSGTDSDAEGEVVFERKSTSDVEKRTQIKLSYEEAVEESGFGLFHGFLLVVCGWANASDAVEILCVSFLLPTARCDLQLRSADMGLLTASIFLGMMVGGYIWGYLADQRGRKKVLVISLTVNGVFGALASLAPGFKLFLALRFISGVGVGGSIPVIFSYFSEFQPRSRRGAMISGLATFWMAGNILAAGLAWLVIPSTSTWLLFGSLDFQSWRLFVVLCSIPSLSSALIFGLAMPESPRFLMEAGREAEALEVFRKMFMLNQRGSSRSFPAVNLNLGHVWISEIMNHMDGTQIYGLVVPSASERKRGREEAAGGSGSHRLTRLLKKGLDPIRQIFTKPLTSRSVVLLIIFFCISFGYYGLWMWFPELFKRTEDGGSPCANMSHAASFPENKKCYPVKTAVYMEGFVTAASNLPGNVFTILVMDCVGGKILLSCSLLLSSLSVFFIWMVKNKTQSLVTSCVFSAVSVISWNALDVVSTELYPTHLRSSALGFFTGVGRIGAIMGNIVFGQLVDTNCAVPVLLVSALLFTGALTALRLPRTKQTELT